MPLSSRQTKHYHLLQQLAEVVIVEGEGADQEGVQDDAAGPHVGPGPVILLTLQHPEGEMRKLRKLLHWKVLHYFNGYRSSVHKGGYHSHLEVATSGKSFNTTRETFE